MSRKKQRRSAATTTNPSAFALWLSGEDINVPGYTRLSDNPEIQTGCLRIAELIGSMTIHLMSNTKDGDVRIQNELSRMIDITPCGTMTRMQWMTAIVMTLLLHGSGNSVVLPSTEGGLLRSMEPIAAGRVQFQPVGGYQDYRILIDGAAWAPEEVLHFAYNPDPVYPWKGRGVTVSLRELARNLHQAQTTKSAFLSSEWKPSIIVKVDATSDVFADPEKRRKFLESYVRPPFQGAPWLIPAEQIQVEQVKPLTLADLAIRDTIELDKRTVAAVLGVPPFLLGVGDFKREAWNSFIQTRVKAIAMVIQQELTRTLIVSPGWYLLLNYWSLIDYDLKQVSDIMLAGADRGYVCGDEWRDRMHLVPAGLKEYKVLENYIPVDMSGKQKKLVQEE